MRYLYFINILMIFSPYFPLLSFVSKDLLSPFSLLMGSMQRLPCNPFLHTTNCRKCRALPGHLEKFLRLLGVSTPILFLWHLYTNYSRLSWESKDDGYINLYDNGLVLWPSLNLGKSAPFFDFFDHGKAYVWLYWILANFFRHWTIHQDMERLMFHKKTQRWQKKWNKNLHENAWFFSRWHSKDSVHAAFGPGSRRARDSASVASSHWGTLPLLPWSFCLGPALRRKKNTKVTTKLSR